MQPWGPWRPDVGGPDKPFCETAQGVVPQAAGTGMGYGPFPRLITATGAEALSGEPRGAIALQKFGGDWTVFAATGTTIEVLDGSFQWSDVETGRNVTATDDVALLHYGSYLLNSDTTDGFKAYNVESPGTNDAVSGAPAARALASCQNVVFAFDCNGNNRRMQSSRQGDYTAWKGGGADGKTFEDGGALIGGRDLQNGAMIVCQESAIRLVTFGVGPTLYGISKIADQRGCVADRTLTAFDGSAFWWDTDGPWQFDKRQGALIPIGAEKINRWADLNIGPSNYQYLQGTVDPARSLVIWRVNSTYALAYNWLIKEWSVIPMATSILTRLATPAVSIDSVSATIDSTALAINARFWQGGATGLGALDTSYKFATFSGTPMAATIKSSQVSADSEPLIKWVKPVSDAANSTLAVGTGASLGGGVTFAAGVAKGSTGWTQQRARARVLQFEENISAGTSWSYSNGVDVGGGPKQ
jgi:hypothetical protein